MDESVKRRVTGAAVLALAGALLLPWLFGNPQDPRAAIRPSFDSVALPTASPAPRASAIPAPPATPRAPVNTPPPATPTPVPSSAVPQARWILQLASFSDASAAQAFLARLQKAGFVAYAEDGSHAGKTWHRVRLRVEGSEAEARRLQSELEKRYRLKAQLLPAR